MTIVEFLTARLDETQADAEAAIADRSGTERWEAKGFPERDRVEWIVRDVEEKYASHGYPGHTPVAGIMPGGPRDGGGVAAHIARHDPARVLAEVKAKRAIIGEHPQVAADRLSPDEPQTGCRTCHVDTHCGETEARGLCETIRYVAAPYADHPDYNPAWSIDS